MEALGAAASTSHSEHGGSRSTAGPTTCAPAAARSGGRAPSWGVSDGSTVAAARVDRRGGAAGGGCAAAPFAASSTAAAAKSRAAKGRRRLGSSMAGSAGRVPGGACAPTGARVARRARTGAGEGREQAWSGQEGAGEVSARLLRWLLSAFLPNLLPPPASIAFLQVFEPGASVGLPITLRERASGTMGCSRRRQRPLQRPARPHTPAAYCSPFFLPECSISHRCTLDSIQCRFRAAQARKAVRLHQLLVQRHLPCGRNDRAARPQPAPPRPLVALLNFACEALASQSRILSSRLSRSAGILAKAGRCAVQPPGCRALRLPYHAPTHKPRSHCTIMSRLLVRQSCQNFTTVHIWHQSKCCRDARRSGGGWGGCRASASCALSTRRQLVATTDGPLLLARA